MPGKTYASANGYRYGFNGMEKDDEVKGSGNSYDFGARIYDSRLGRFLSIDKFADKFPNQSGYIFAGNSPISAIDIKGDSIYIVVGRQVLGAAIDMIMKMPNGKELIEKYANSNTTNLYIAVGNSGYSSAGGWTYRLLPGSDKITDKKTVNIQPFETDPAQQGAADKIDAAFGNMFNGSWVDPAKENFLIIIEPPKELDEDKFERFIATIIHEMAAHVCEGCNHGTFGMSGNFWRDVPPPGTEAEKWRNELEGIQNTTEFNKKSDAFYSSDPINTEAEKKQKRVPYNTSSPKK